MRHELDLHAPSHRSKADSGGLKSPSSVRLPASAGRGGGLRGGSGARELDFQWKDEENQSYCYNHDGSDVNIPRGLSPREELDLVIMRYEAQHGPIVVKTQTLPPARKVESLDGHRRESRHESQEDPLYEGGKSAPVVDDAPSPLASADASRLRSSASRSAVDLDHFLEQIQLNRHHERNQRRARERLIQSEMALELLTSSVTHSLAVDALMTVRNASGVSQLRDAEHLDMLLFSDAPASLPPPRNEGSRHSKDRNASSLLVIDKEALDALSSAAVRPSLECEVPSAARAQGAAPPQPVSGSAVSVSGSAACAAGLIPDRGGGLHPSVDINEESAGSVHKSSRVEVLKATDLKRHETEHHADHSLLEAFFGSSHDRVGALHDQTRLLSSSETAEHPSVPPSARPPRSDLQDSLREIDELKVWLERFRLQRQDFAGGLGEGSVPLPAPVVSDSEPAIPENRLNRPQDIASPVKKLVNNSSSQASVVSDGSILFDPSFWQSLPRLDRYGSLDPTPSFLLDDAEARATDGLPPIGTALPRHSTH